MSEQSYSDRMKRAQELDALVGRVLASMNAGRYRPIPASEHSLIAEVCAEVLDLERKREVS